MSDKCAFERRAYPPGEHGQGMHRKRTNYGLQLREKQKVRRLYGVLEKQFRNYYAKAARMKGKTGENLLCLLELRLDNVVFRLGFASSLKQARQLVSHGHFKLNGKKVDIASIKVKVDDIISVKEKSRNCKVMVEILEKHSTRSMPRWLELDSKAMTGKVIDMPTREDITYPINEQLIVELYSK